MSSKEKFVRREGEAERSSDLNSRQPRLKMECSTSSVKTAAGSIAKSGMLGQVIIDSGGQRSDNNSCTYYCTTIPFLNLEKVLRKCSVLADFHHCLATLCHCLHTKATHKHADIKQR